MCKTEWRHVVWSPEQGALGLSCLHAVQTLKVAKVHVVYGVKYTSLCRGVDNLGVMFGEWVRSDVEVM